MPILISRSHVQLLNALQNMLLPAASMVSPYAVISVRIVQVEIKLDFFSSFRVETE